MADESTTLKSCNTATIKNFGNDTIVHSVIELKAALVEKYTNKSVTIMFDEPSGLKGLSHVDVDSKGNLLHSYFNKPVSCEAFNLPES